MISRWDEAERRLRHIPGSPIYCDVDDAVAERQAALEHAADGWGVGRHSRT